MAKPLPNLNRLKHCFEISEESPSGLIWKNPTANCVRAGMTAGRKNSGGYWEVSLDSVRYKVHRIIYFMKTGEDPKEFDIDHRRGDLDDNIDVRKVTKSQNLANSRPRKNSSSKYKGVWKAKNRDKWYAEIQVQNERIYIGVFNDEVEAAKAYNKKAIEYFGDYCWINEIPDPSDSG